MENMELIYKSAIFSICYRVCYRKIRNISSHIKNLLGDVPLHRCPSVGFAASRAKGEVNALAPPQALFVGFEARSVGSVHDVHRA